MKTSFLCWFLVKPRIKKEQIWSYPPNPVFFFLTSPKAPFKRRHEHSNPRDLGETLPAEAEGLQNTTRCKIPTSDLKAVVSWGFVWIHTRLLGSVNLKFCSSMLIIFGRSVDLSSGRGGFFGTFFASASRMRLSFKHHQDNLFQWPSILHCTSSPSASSPPSLPPLHCYLKMNESVDSW